jgi:hypothetical protein
MRRLTDESGQHRVLALALASAGCGGGRGGRKRVRDIEFLRHRLRCGARLLATYWSRVRRRLPAQPTSSRVLFAAAVRRAEVQKMTLRDHSIQMLL